MDFHESIDNCRYHLGKAKSLFCLCEYHNALASLVKAYEVNRSLIEYVYTLNRDEVLAQGPAGEPKGGP